MARVKFATKNLISTMLNLHFYTASRSVRISLVLMTMRCPMAMDRVQFQKG